jgi:hypothetical protein
MGGSGAESPGSQSGKGKRGEVAAKMKLWGGGAGSKGGGIKGRVGLDRLEEEAQAQGQTLEILPTGFKLKTDDLEREVTFYAGFEPKKLPAGLDKPLGLEILKSPGLQRVLVEETKALTILKRLWRKWQQGQDADRLKSKTFTEYVGRKKYRVSVDDKTPISAVIAKFGELSPKEQAKALLNTTESELLTKLPARLLAKVEALLAEPNLLAKSLFVEEARKPLIARLNLRLANNVQSLEEFEEVVQVIKQFASRGAIGEGFFARFIAGERTRDLASRKPYFEAEIYGGEDSCQPDRLRPLSRRTLDVKVGYSTKTVDSDQMDKYALLVKNSRGTEYPLLKQQLEALGVTKGRLAGHDYVFLSEGNVKAEIAARRTFQDIQDRNLAEVMQVYFVENYLDENSTSQIGVYRLVLDQENDIIDRRFIGNRLPD